MDSANVSGLRILVVEDDAIDRKQIERLLAGSSLPQYDLEFADRLEKAIALLDERHFDILLLDLNLPDSNGLETLRIMERKYPVLPKVVVTSGDNEELGLEAVARGAQDYLHKGKFNARALARVIHYSVERKKSEERLWQSRSRLNAILESIGDPMIMLDKDLNITWSNEASRRVFGEHGVGKKCFEFFRNRDAPCEHGPCIVRDAFRDGRPHSYDIQVIDKEKQTRYFHCTANVALHDDAGNPTEVIEIARDVTDRKSTEIIRAAYARIEKANRELKEMQSQLVQSEKLASIGQLAAGVAHEMNTPVGFVACNFETLERYMKKIHRLLDAYDGLTREVEALGSSEQMKTAQSIRDLKTEIRLDFILKDLNSLFDDSRDGLERVTEIIQNLRDFARADRTSDFTEHDINEGIRATLTMARNEIKYDTETKTELGDIPHVFCNPGQINQVFLNILINAAQAIRSQNRSDKGNIVVRTYQTEVDVICEIEDDGPGIPAANLQKIFDPFFTTKPPGKGTGLGLSVSYDIIVNKHHGQIFVESEECRGAKFTIRLPIAPAVQTNDTPEEVLTGVENDG